MAENLLDSLKFSFPFLQNLKILNFTRCRFGDHLVPQVVQVLQAAPNLTELDLTNIGLTGVGIRQLGEEYLAGEN